MSACVVDTRVVWLITGLESLITRPYTNATATCDGMHSLSQANCNCGDTGDPKCPAHPPCPDACPAVRRPAVTISGFVHLHGGVGSENTTTLAAVARGPVVTEVDCEAKAFKNYKSGIITACTSPLHKFSRNRLSATTTNLN